MEVTMKKKICQYLSKVLVEMSEEELMKTMEIPPEENGRFSIALFYNGKENVQKSYADCR